MKWKDTNRLCCNQRKFQEHRMLYELIITTNENILTTINVGFIWLRSMLSLILLFPVAIWHVVVLSVDNDAALTVND